MKVLFVSSGNSENGIVPFIKGQGNSLINEGIDLDFFTINSKGVKGYLKNIIRLREYIKNEKFDIIHAHYGISAIVAFIAKSKEKLIVSFMGDDLIGSKNFNGDIKFTSKLFIYFNRLLAKYFSDFNIVKSEEMLKVLNVPKSQVIPNGVDFNQFYEIKKDFAKDYLNEERSLKKVLFCSNPNRPEKNFKLAKDAVSILTDQSINLQYLYGINQDDLVYHYNSAECVLLTSFHEGSPNVVKEAMACNVPIVSTNVGDVQNVIKETEGCYISTFKAKDVASKIKKAINFEKKTTGRRNIEHLESSVIAKKIVEIYKKVL